MQGGKRLHVAVVPIDYGTDDGVPDLDVGHTIEACVCMHCFAVYIPEDSMGELGKIAAGKDPEPSMRIKDFRVDEVSLVERPLPGREFLRTILGDDDSDANED